MSLTLVLIQCSQSNFTAHYVNEYFLKIGLSLLGVSPTSAVVTGAVGLNADVTQWGHLLVTER